MFWLGGGTPPIPLVGKILNSSLWHVFGKKNFFQVSQLVPVFTGLHMELIKLLLLILL